MNENKGVLCFLLTQLMFMADNTLKVPPLLLFTPATMIQRKLCCCWIIWPHVRFWCVAFGDCLGLNTGFLVLSRRDLDF